MADNDFDKMLDFWSKGSEAFMQAQVDMAGKFAEAMSPKPKDPFQESIEAWQKFIQASAPGWDPSMFGHQGFTGQRNAFFTMFDTSTWAAQAP